VRLVAIGLAAGLFSALFGMRGDVNVGYAALVGIPAAVGALAGTTLQQRIATTTLTYGFALLLAAIGAWLVWP